MNNTFFKIRNAHLKFFILCCIWLGHLNYCHCQLYEFVAEKFTKDHGLEDDYIKDLDFDKSGNVWLLTRKGITVFDGLSFRKVVINSDLPIQQFVIDENDNIWLNLSFPAENSLIKERIIIYNVALNKIVSLKEYCDVSEFDNSMYSQILKNSSGQIILRQLRGKMYKFSDGAIKCIYKNPNKLSLEDRNRNNAFLMLYDFNKNIKALVDIETNEEKIMPLSPENEMHQIWNDGNIEFQLSYNYNLRENGRISREKKIISRLGDTLNFESNNRIVYDFCDRDFFFMYDNELEVYNIDTKSREKLNQKFSKLFSNADLINFKFSEKVLWIGTSEGLIKIEKVKNIFESYIDQTNLSTREMMMVGVDSILICTERGVYFLDINKNKILNVFNPNFRTYGITQISDKKYLVGTYGNSLIHIDISKLPTSKVMKYINYDLPNNGKHVQHLNTYLDHNGFLWVATSEGVKIYNSAYDTAQSSILFNDLKEIHFSVILQGPDKNQLFLLSSTGLYIANTNNFKIRKIDALDQKIIAHVAMDKDDPSIYWVATRFSGLLKWKYNKEVIEEITVSDGLSHNNVHSVFEDDYARLWMSTNFGISIYNKQTSEVSIITEENGLHENEMNKNSFHFANDSLVFYGGINGIVKFNPYELRLENYGGQLEKITFNYTSSNKSESILLDKNVGKIRIKRNYKNPKIVFNIPENSFSNMLKYTFSNDNNSWSYTQRNTIDLSEINDGKSTMFVCNKLGVNEWSSPRQYEIYKAPPFYKSYWFYGTLLSLISIGIFFYLNNRRLNVLKLNRRIQQEVDRKTKELYYKNRSLSDSKKLNEQLFSIIGHDLRSPLISLNNISKSLKHLYESGEIGDAIKLSHTIEANSKKSLQVIDRLIDWTRRQKESMLDFQEVNLHECLNEVISEQREDANRKDIVINLIGPKWIKCISNKDSLAIVFRNILANAIKFSLKGAEIDVRLIQIKSNINIEIEDYGLGIYENRIKKLNKGISVESKESISGEVGLGMGISISHEILNKINGSMVFESDVGKGTKVIIILPL